MADAAPAPAAAAGGGGGGDAPLTDEEMMAYFARTGDMQALLCNPADPAAIRLIRVPAEMPAALETGVTMQTDPSTGITCLRYSNEEAAGTVARRGTNKLVVAADYSGSMAGYKKDVTRTLKNFCAGARGVIPKGYGLIAVYGVNAVVIDATSTDAEIDAAIRRVDSGGTNYQAALAALEPHLKRGEPLTVVFMTDGADTSGSGVQWMNTISRWNRTFTILKMQGIYFNTSGGYGERNLEKLRVGLTAGGAVAPDMCLKPDIDAVTALLSDSVAELATQCVATVHFAPGIEIMLQVFDDGAKVSGVTLLDEELALPADGVVVVLTDSAGAEMARHTLPTATHVGRIEPEDETDALGLLAASTIGALERNVADARAGNIAGLVAVGKTLDTLLKRSAALALPPDDPLVLQLGEAKEVLQQVVQAGVAAAGAPQLPTSVTRGLGLLSRNLRWTATRENVAAKTRKAADKAAGRKQRQTAAFAQKTIEALARFRILFNEWAAAPSRAVRVPAGYTCPIEQQEGEFLGLGIMVIGPGARLEGAADAADAMGVISPAMTTATVVPYSKDGMIACKVHDVQGGGLRTDGVFIPVVDPAVHRELIAAGSRIFVSTIISGVPTIGPPNEPLAYAGIAAWVVEEHPSVAAALRPWWGIPAVDTGVYADVVAKLQLLTGTVDREAKGRLPTAIAALVLAHWVEPDDRPATLRTALFANARAAVKRRVQSGTPKPLDLDALAATFDPAGLRRVRDSDAAEVLAEIEGGVTAPADIAKLFDAHSEHRFVDPEPTAATAEEAIGQLWRLCPGVARDAAGNAGAGAAHHAAVVPWPKLGRLAKKFADLEDVATTDGWPEEPARGGVTSSSVPDKHLFDAAVDDADVIDTALVLAAAGHDGAQIEELVPDGDTVDVAAALGGASLTAAAATKHREALAANVVALAVDAGSFDARIALVRYAAEVGMLEGGKALIRAIRTGGRARSKPVVETCTGDVIAKFPSIVPVLAAAAAGMVTKNKADFGLLSSTQLRIEAVRTALVQTGVVTEEEIEATLDTSMPGRSAGFPNRPAFNAACRNLLACAEVQHGDETRTVQVRRDGKSITFVDPALHGKTECVLAKTKDDGDAIAASRPFPDKVVVAVLSETQITGSILDFRYRWKALGTAKAVVFDTATQPPLAVAVAYKPAEAVQTVDRSPAGHWPADWSHHIMCESAFSTRYHAALDGDRRLGNQTEELYQGVVKLRNAGRAGYAGGGRRVDPPLAIVADESYLALFPEGDAEVVPPFWFRHTLFDTEDVAIMWYLGREASRMVQVALKDGSVLHRTCGGDWKDGPAPVAADPENRPAGSLTAGALAQVVDRLRAL